MGLGWRGLRLGLRPGQHKGWGWGRCVSAEGSRLDVLRTFEESRTRKRWRPCRSPGSLTSSEPREKADSRRVIIACPRAAGAAPPRDGLRRAPRAKDKPPRAKDMPPSSLRAMVCSSAVACNSGSISLQVKARAVQHAGQCASWAVWVVGSVVWVGRTSSSARASPAPVWPAPARPHASRQ